MEDSSSSNPCAPKTSVSKEAKTTFMPFVASAVGLLGTAWGKSWLDQMVVAGLAVRDPYDPTMLTFPTGCILPKICEMEAGAMALQLAQRRESG
jgi:hypothetical protein